MVLGNGNSKTLTAVDTVTGAVAELPARKVLVHAKDEDVRIHWGSSTVVVGSITATDPVVPAGTTLELDAPGSLDTHVAVLALSGTTNVYILGVS